MSAEVKTKTTPAQQLLLMRVEDLLKTITLDDLVMVSTKHKPTQYFKTTQGVSGKGGRKGPLDFDAVEMLADIQIEYRNYQNGLEVDYRHLAKCYIFLLSILKL